MAKRQVNTKFVISMAVVVTASAAALGAYGWAKYNKGHDPKLFQMQAEEALKVGNREQALVSYGNAYKEAHKKRMPIAAEYAAKEAELLYDSTVTRADAYREAITWWKQSLLEDPTYKPSLDRLVHEYYLMARHQPQQMMPWPEVEKQAAEALRSDPTNAEACMAEGVAIASQISPTTDRGTVRFKKAQEDLQKAVVLAKKPFDPALTAFETAQKTLEAIKNVAAAQQNLDNDSGSLENQKSLRDAKAALAAAQEEMRTAQAALKAAAKAAPAAPEDAPAAPKDTSPAVKEAQGALNDATAAIGALPAMSDEKLTLIGALSALSSFDLLNADDLEKSNKAKEVKDLRTAATARIMEFMNLFPDSLEGRLAYVEMLEALKDLPTAMDVLQTAITELPNNSAVYLKLVELYSAQRNAADAEKSLLKVLEIDAGNLDARRRLADYYQSRGLHDKAIEQYQLILSTKSTVVGLEAFSRQETTIRGATENLCWEYLEVAQAAGVKTADGAAAMKKAKEICDQIQKLRPTDAVLKLFDGRMDLMQGSIAPATMKLTQANDIFSGRSAADPNWRRTKLLLVDAYTQAEMSGNAIDFLNQLLDKQPTHPGFLLKRSELQMRLKLYGEAFNGAMKATEVLKQLQKADPKIDPKPAQQVALAAGERLLASSEIKPEQKQALTAAISDLRQALGPIEVDLGSATDLLLAGKSQEAIDILRPVVEQQPESMESRSLLVTALLQQMTKLKAVGDDSHADDLRKEARKHLDALLAKYPNETRLKAQSAMVDSPNATFDEITRQLISSLDDEYQKDMAWAGYYQVRANTDEQLNYLKKAEAAKPDDNTAIDRIFQILLYKKDWTQAEEYLQKAVLKNIDGVNGKFFQGQLELNRGHVTDAIATLKNAAALRPDFAMGQALLAQAYSAAGQIPAAEDAYVTALKQSPNNIAAIKGLIAINYMRRDAASLEKAMEYLKAGLTYSSNDTELRNWQDLIGDPKDAAARREAIRDAAPKDYDNLQRLSLVYQRLGQLPKAIDIYQPVYDAMGQNLVVADNMARLLQAAGRSVDATKVYQKFIVSDKVEEKFVANIMLGDMSRSQGQIKDAEDYYRTAIKYKPQPANTDGERKLADMQFETEKFAESEVLYKDLVKITDGKDPLVLNRYVEALVRQGKYDEADKLLTGDILKKNPKDQESIILLGYLRMSQKRVKEANDVFDSALTINPNNINARYYRALLQFASQGDLQAAITDLQLIRKLDASNVKARELLARIYRQTGKYNEAVQEYQAVLERSPERAQTRLELAQFLMAMVQSSLRIPAESTQDYPVMIRAIKPTETLNNLLADSIKQFPNEPVWHVLQGNLAETLGQDQQALGIYQAVWQSQQQSPQAAIPFMTALIKAKNYESVIKVANQLMPQAPDNVSLWLKRGEAYAGQGDAMDKALADFQYSLDKTVNNVPDYLLVASEMGKSLPHDMAVNELQKRLTNDPKHIPTRLALAQLEQSDKKFDEAANAVRPMLDDPAAKAVKPLVLRVVAMAAFEGGRFQEAADYYKTLVDLTPDDIASLNNLAFILADDLKKPAEAMPYADRAVKILKGSVGEAVMLNNGNVNDTYGWVKYRNGDMAGAVVALSKSLESDPTPLTYYHLALVLQAQKKIALALTNAQASVDMATKIKDTETLTKAQALVAELKNSGN